LTRDQDNLVLEKVFSTVDIYLVDVNRHLSSIKGSNRNAEKVHSALFSLLVDAYIERLIMAIDSKLEYKLIYPTTGVLLPEIQKDIKRKKLVKPKDLVEFAKIEE